MRSRSIGTPVSRRQSGELCLPGLAVKEEYGGRHMLHCRGLILSVPLQEVPMTRKFKVGDHVGWNSEAGHVSGTIIKVHVRDFDYKGHTHRASAEDPQYEIKS